MEVICRVVRQRILSYFARSGLTADVECILPRLVGKISNALPIGRPRRFALHHTWSIGDIARRTFFNGDREDVAMRFEYSAQPSRRDAVVLDIAICRGKTWAHFRQVSVHVHI